MGSENPYDQVGIFEAGNLDHACWICQAAHGREMTLRKAMKIGNIVCETPDICNSQLRVDDNHGTE